MAYLVNQVKEGIIYKEVLARGRVTLRQGRAPIRSQLMI